MYDAAERTLDALERGGVTGVDAELLRTRARIAYGEIRRTMDRMELLLEDIQATLGAA